MQAERVEAYFIMLCIHWRGILYHQPCHVPISKYLYDISCGLSIHYPKTQYIAGRKRRSLDHINKEKLIIRRLNLVNNLTKKIFFARICNIALDSSPQYIPTPIPIQNK